MSDDIEKIDGPIITNQDGNLITDVALCRWGKKQCKHLGIHDFHYFYCAAQEAPNKHAKPGAYAYPWHGAGKRLSHNEPDYGCPYITWTLKKPEDKQ